MLPSDSARMAPPRLKPMIAPLRTATSDLPLSDCTIAVSLAPRPDSASVRLPVPASQSMPAVSFSSGCAAMPVSCTLAATAASAPEPSSVTKPLPRPS